MWTTIGSTPPPLPATGITPVPISGQGAWSVVGEKVRLDNQTTRTYKVTGIRKVLGRTYWQRYDSYEAEYEAESEEEAEELFLADIDNTNIDCDYGDEEVQDSETDEEHDIEDIEVTEV